MHTIQWLGVSNKGELSVIIEGSTESGIRWAKVLLKLGGFKRQRT